MKNTHIRICLSIGLVASVLVLIALLGTAATLYAPAPARASDDPLQPDTLVAIGFTNLQTTSTWANTTGWARLASVGVACVSNISNTAQISVTRYEGVSEVIATVVSTNAASYRWSASTPNDVVIRLGDSVQVTLTETNNGGGQVYLSLEK
jgi:hypothetical protein